MQYRTMGRRLLAPFLFLLVLVQCAAALAAAPDISADAAIVVDRGTGAVLYEKNADKREYPASMTKMMTCLLALDELGKVHVVNGEACIACGQCELRCPDYAIFMDKLDDKKGATA